MPLDSASPELVYTSKGNIAYPTSGGIDGVQTAAQLATLAQRRHADELSGSLQSSVGTITTAVSGATTTLTCSGGISAAIPSGANVTVVGSNAAMTFVTSAAAAAGATAVTVTSATPAVTLPVGSALVYGGFASTVGPGPNIAAQ